MRSLLLVLCVALWAVSTQSKRLNRAMLKENQLESEADAALQKGTIEVQLLLIRHGHACHNAMNHQGKVKLHCKYPDPPLTDCGVFQTGCNGEMLQDQLKKKQGWKPDLVGSSAMMRAIET